MLWMRSHEQGNARTRNDDGDLSKRGSSQDAE